MDNGADINLCLNSGDSPFKTAYQHDHNNTVQLLRNISADID